MHYIPHENLLLCLLQGWGEENDAVPGIQTVPDCMGCHQEQHNVKYFFLGSSRSLHLWAVQSGCEGLMHIPFMEHLCQVLCPPSVPPVCQSTCTSSPSCTGFPEESGQNPHIFSWDIFLSIRKIMQGNLMWGLKPPLSPFQLNCGQEHEVSEKIWPTTEANLYWKGKQNSFLEGFDGKCGIPYADWCKNGFCSTAKVTASSSNQPWKHHWSKLKSCPKSICICNFYYSLFKLSRFVFGLLEETDPSYIILLWVSPKS